MAKTGRNDPCPCGSGEKYKKCCLPKSTEAAGLEGSLNGKLANALMKFCKRNFTDELGEAYYEFWGDFDPEEKLPESHRWMGEINFWEWVVFDWRPYADDENTMIERFMENAKGLSGLDLQVLRKMNDSVISLYEVLDARSGEGLTLKDLIQGGVYEVKEKSASASLRKWDIFAARLLLLDGVYIINGSIYPYSLEGKAEMLKVLREELKLYKRDFPGASDRDFLKRVGPIFNLFWTMPFETPFMPKLRTSSGEALVFCKAIYEISDMDSAVRAMDSHPDIVKTGVNSFSWEGHGKEMNDTVIYGNIELKKSRLTLECNSKERLKKGKELIAGLALGNAKHKGDVFEDVYKMLEARRGKPAPERDPSEEIPPEVKQELYENFIRKHYEKTLTEKLPIFGGKKPVDAVKTKPGRKKVIEWLKLLENSEEDKKRIGQPNIDLTWMWERLGIDKTEATS